VITANCREKFTEKDFLFIVDTLADNAKSKQEALVALLSDPGSLDTILDDDNLFQKITQSSAFSEISPYLYFYLLTRHVLNEYDVDDRNVADYVAAMLARFCSSSRMHGISSEHQRNYRYLVDMMVDATNASPREAFLIRSHMGNYSLFITGLFPDYVYRQSTYGRKSPGFDYYEQMGRSSFQWASQHRLALQFSLAEILSSLSDNFRQIRIALNCLTDQYIRLDEGGSTLDKILRQIFFGSKPSDEPEA